MNILNDIASILLIRILKGFATNNITIQIRVIKTVGKLIVIQFTTLKKRSRVLVDEMYEYN